MLGIVDFAAVERHACAVFLRVVNELERIIRGAGAPAENADDEIGIVLGELFHCLGAVIDDLQEIGTAGIRHTGEGADDVVVDEFAQLFGRDAAGDIRVEDLEEMAEFFTFGFFAEFLIPEQRLAVLFQFVDEGH